MIQTKKPLFVDKVKLIVFIVDKQGNALPVSTIDADSAKDLAIKCKNFDMWVNATFEDVDIPF
jgi:hypothetical protein